MRNLAVARKQATHPIPAPCSQELAHIIVDACSEAKARDPILLSTHLTSDMFSYAIIVSGTSDRQVQGITNRVVDALEAMGIRPHAIEGMDQAHWVIVDCGDVVLHVFYEPMRSHYDLEALWAEAPKLEPMN